MTDDVCFGLQSKFSVYELIADGQGSDHVRLTRSRSGFPDLTKPLIVGAAGRLQGKDLQGTSKACHRHLAVIRSPIFTILDVGENLFKRRLDHVVKTLQLLLLVHRDVRVLGDEQIEVALVCWSSHGFGCSDMCMILEDLGIVEVATQGQFLLEAVEMRRCHTDDVGHQ
jgi:hypothetical protein